MQRIKRCDNCTFSTFAVGSGRPTLICRQQKGCEGRWTSHDLLENCGNFYPSRSAEADNCRPRLIPLTRGKFAVVDAEDYEELSKFKWHAEGAKRTDYATRGKSGECIKMHRQIMKAPPGLLVDHIDRNGLNNRKSNLRLATKAQNSQNQTRRANNRSKYKGVCWHKGKKKWEANITANRKTHHLGNFKDEIEAAKAYDEAAERLHGQFAVLNFPQSES